MVLAYRKQAKDRTSSSGDTSWVVGLNQIPVIFTFSVAANPVAPGLIRTDLKFFKIITPPLGAA